MDLNCQELASIGCASGTAARGTWRRTIEIDFISEVRATLVAYNQTLKMLTDQNT